MIKKDINIEKEKNHSPKKNKNTISSFHSENENNNHYDYEKYKIIQNNKKLFEKHMSEKLNSPQKKLKKKNERIQFENLINKEILNINKNNYNLYKSNFTIHLPHRLLSDNAMLKRTHLLLTEKTTKNKSFKEKLNQVNNFDKRNKFVSEMLLNNKYNLNLINNSNNMNNCNNKKRKSKNKGINDKPSIKNSKTTSSKDVVNKIESKKKIFFCIPCF